MNIDEFLSVCYCLLGKCSRSSILNCQFGIIYASVASMLVCCCKYGVLLAYVFAYWLAHGAMSNIVPHLSSSVLDGQTIVIYLTYLEAFANCHPFIQSI